jgi:hypothetical protein
VLTERQTDAMMAGIEATAAAIAEAARARTVLLIELQLGDLATMAEAQVRILDIGLGVIAQPVIQRIPRLPSATLLKGASVLRAAANTHKRVPSSTDLLRFGRRRLQLARSRLGPRKRRPTWTARRRSSRASQKSQRDAKSRIGSLPRS